MKIIGSLALVALMLLSWLCFSGVNTGVPDDAQAFAALDQFTATEHKLRENILDARLGLLQNYDPLDDEMDELQDLALHLQRDGATAATVAKLQDLLSQQSALVEQFKSENALLQNALAYFGLLTSLFPRTSGNGALAAHIATLSTAMLDLMIEPSGGAARPVYNDLQSLSAEPVTGTDVDLKNGLLVHGQTLYELLPAVAATLGALTEIPFVAREADIRAQIAAHQRRLQVAADRYQLLLYTVSVVFLLLIVVLGGKLITSLAALRRRVAFEHAMAAISMRFAGAGMSEMRSAVEAALAELAFLVGADRACFILSPPQETYLWARERAVWPREAPVIRADVLAQRDAILYFPRIDRMPAGAEKDVFLERGIVGWLCIPGHSDGFVTRILEFESLSKPMVWPATDLGLLRAAADDIANAVQRAQSEREHARLEASLEARRRMETVGALAAGVAHNFNNVIAAILGHVETQTMDLIPGSQAARSAEGVRQAAEHARDLVDQVLHFGVQKVGLPHKVSLAALMTRTKAQLIAALPSGTRIVVREIPEEAVIWGDESQLQQVIMTLCINAHQAMSEGGTINVAIGLRSSEQTLALSHGRLTAGAYAQVNVSDTGYGMDEAALERLFEPFFTTKARGNGLGLATALEIVRAHGGAINVRSTPGEGSVFEVFLPLAPVNEPEHDYSSMVAPGGGQMILIVHEDAARLLRYEEIVAALGYEPVGYARSEEALVALRAEPGKFDAVLIVSKLSLDKGLTLAAGIHAVSARLPILLAVSHHGLASEQLAAAGIAAVIHTPIVAAELAAALGRWVAPLNGPMQT